MAKPEKDIHEIIRNRRTIHNFKPVPVPPVEEIISAIDLAVCAPNHHSTEPWRFYLLGDETREKICRLNADITGRTRGEKAARIKLDKWREVPGWLLLTCIKSVNEIRFMEDYAACCCASENLMLYLWSRGIGVKWTTGSVTRDPQFYEIIGFDPEEEIVVGMFWYGYPEEVPSANKKSIDEKLVELP